MKVSRIRKGVALVVAAGALGLGCELIVDFDRTKIPIEGTDSATPTGDSSVDATIDTSSPDTGTDAPQEAALGDADAGDAGDLDADAGD